MMTVNMQMEQFSLAYIRDVAARGGYQVTRHEPDLDSVDGVLMSSERRRRGSNFRPRQPLEMS